MAQISVAVLVGSLRKDSINRKLANALIKLGPPDFSFKELRIGDLPLYNQDDDTGNPPPAWTAFRERIKASDAVLFVVDGRAGLTLADRAVERDRVAADLQHPPRLRDAHRPGEPVRARPAAVLRRRGTAAHPS